jgi:hypothetical protein
MHTFQAALGSTILSAFLLACASPGANRGGGGESSARAGDAEEAPSGTCLGPADLPMPPQPRILRDVAQVSEDGTTPATNAPPALRVTRDGRIGLNVKMSNAVGGTTSRYVKLFLLSPEQAPSDGQLGLVADEFSIDLQNLGAGVQKVPWNNGKFPSTFEIRHATICPAPTTVIAAPDGENDAYDLTLIGFTDTTNQSTETWQVDVHLVVLNPKTAQAALDRQNSYVKRIVQGPTLTTVPMALEPMTTSDGQLLVARTGSPTTFDTFTSQYNIFYAYSQSPGGFCDVAKFATEFQPKPILYAPHDPLLKDENGVPRYGLAARPMRDPMNQRLVTDAQVSGPPFDVPNLAGTYPWIDMAGRNLFFYALHSTNSFSGSEQTRFPTTCVSGSSCAKAETLDNTRGLSVMGSWTNGKAVLLDGLINNIDFGYGVGADGQRNLALYADADPIRFASGRANGVVSLGPAVDNITIVDSLENLHNDKAAWQPRTRRDVVWKVSRGHVSDEVAFDDFIDPNVFLYAPMNGVANLLNGRYLDGFEQPDPQCSQAADGTFLDGAVRVQNAATMPTEMGDIPAAGTVTSDVRIEPAALGGIHGRGLYLPAGASLQFLLTNHGQASSQHSWYTGFFVDGAQAGQALEIDGRFSVSLNPHSVTITPTGQSARTAATTPTLLGAGWTHIGLLVQVEGATPSVALYVNGDYVATANWPASAMATFYPDWADDTALTLSPGEAWVDELKIIMNAGFMSALPEITCNHARGSMIQPSSGASFCRPAADNGAVTVGAGETSLRSAQLFAGAKLVASLPRPDFSTNAFCTTCHVPTSMDPERLVSLQPAALGRSSYKRLDTDPRRQPLIPPRELFGNIPAGNIDAAPNFSPGSNQVCAPPLTRPCNVDDYLFP